MEVLQLPGHLRRSFFLSQSTTTGQGMEAGGQGDKMFIGLILWQKYRIGEFVDPKTMSRPGQRIGSRVRQRANKMTGIANRSNVVSRKFLSKCDGLGGEAFSSPFEAQ